MQKPIVSTRFEIKKYVDEKIKIFILIFDSFYAWKSMSLLTKRAETALNNSLPSVGPTVILFESFVEKY